MSKRAKEEWGVFYWKPLSSSNSPVMKELEKNLKGNKSALKKFYALVEVLEKNGPFVGMPYCKDVGGIYELRDVGNGKRYYFKETEFVFQDGQDIKIVLLIAVCGDKGTQKKDIENAKNRLGQISLDNILNEENLEIVKKENRS